MSDYHDIVREAVAKKMLDIAAYREKYIEAWIAATGLHPTECELIQQELPALGVTRIWAHRKGDPIVLP